MTETIHTTAQLLDPGPLVTLYVLDLTPIGGDTHYFCTSTLDNGNPVYFGGQEFSPMPVDATGFERTSKGQLPTPTMQISNVLGGAAALLFAQGDILGGKLIRIRTHKQFLDGQPRAGLGITYTQDVYIVDRKSAQNKVFIEFEMRSILDAAGVMLPRQQVLRDTCGHIYRRYVNGEFVYTKVSCPYVQDVYFTRTGNTTDQASADVCGKRLSDCKLRFGTKPLPFRGFPGVARNR